MKKEKIRRRLILRDLFHVDKTESTYNLFNKNITLDIYIESKLLAAVLQYLCHSICIIEFLQISTKKIKNFR